MSPGRRQFVGFAGTTVLALVAGCLNQPTEFLVTDTVVIHQEGERHYDYPEDVSVRIGIDNTTPERQDGTLVATLERTDGDGKVLESWTKRQDISLSRGTNQREILVFENVFDTGDDIDNFRMQAHIEQ